MRRGDPHRRPVEVVERFVRHDRHDLGAPAAQPQIFLDGEQPMRARDRAEDGLRVERHQRAHVDHFAVDAVFRLEFFSSIERARYHQRQRDNGRILAGTHDFCGTKSVDDFAVRHRAFGRIERLVLEKDDRIGIAHSRRQQADDVERGRRRHHLEAGDHHAPILDALAVLGAEARAGAQHSQSVENWCMMIPGLKVVAPSTPLDVIGLLAAAVRDPDPVIFLEHKSLYATKGEVPDGEIVDTLGTAKIVRPGKDATIIALALMVSRALEAAEKLKAEHGIDCEVIDVRSLVPLDTQTILGSVARTHRLFTVEENPRLCGWGAEIVSIVADEAFYDLDGPPVRITTPHIPLPAADILEDAVLPTPDRIADTVRRSLGS